MKAYTDLEQSKKLAEILPLESVDMHYHYDFDFDELESIPTITEEEPKEHFLLFPKDIPCWSLAALLSLIPLSIYDEDNYSYELKIDMIDKMPRFVRLEDCYHSDFPYDFGKDNLLDNVVESIIWLKENGKI